MLFFLLLLLVSLFDDLGMGEAIETVGVQEENEEESRPEDYREGGSQYGPIVVEHSVSLSDDNTKWVAVGNNDGNHSLCLCP